MNNSDYTIIDNFLENFEFNQIRSVMEGADFPWFFQNAVAELSNTHLTDYYFSHTFYRSDTNMPSQMINVVMPILKKLPINRLIRAKANLYPNVGTLLENHAHTDFPFDHNGAIFYINSNNGFTILHDGTKIESVANRILFFNSSLLHNSTHCTDKKVRININFNYF